MLDVGAHVGGVELFHCLDDPFDHTSRGVVTGVLANGDYSDPMLSEQAFVGDADLAVSGESAVFPYEDDVEGVAVVGGVMDHPLETWSLCGLSALGLVLICPDNLATVGLDKSFSGGLL